MTKCLGMLKCSSCLAMHRGLQTTFVQKPLGLRIWTRVSPTYSTHSCKFGKAKPEPRLSSSGKFLSGKRRCGGIGVRFPSLWFWEAVVAAAVGRTLSSRVHGSWLSGRWMLRVWQFVLKLSCSRLLPPQLLQCGRTPEQVTASPFSMLLRFFPNV